MKNSLRKIGRPKNVKLVLSNSDNKRSKNYKQKSPFQQLLEDIKKLKFKDLIIAATAKLHNLTLITADKDFSAIKGLKILYYKYFIILLDS